MSAGELSLRGGAAGELGDIFADGGGGDRDGNEDDDVPLGKEPQLWELARDLVTSMVSDLAVVSCARGGGRGLSRWRSCGCCRVQC